MEYIYTYLWAITPIVELRGAIPIGYLHYQLGIIPVTLLGILGGLTIVVFCMVTLPLVFKVMERFSLLKKLKDALLERTRKNYSDKLLLWGEVFLVLLVALPLPGSGAFTGSLVAYLFGIPLKTAFLLISFGTVISGLIVAGLTLSSQSLWEFISEIL